MDTLAIDRNALPTLRFRTEDLPQATTNRYLYEEDRQIVIDGLIQFFESEECKALAIAKPGSYAVVRDKIEKAISDTTDGESFSHWRKEYATKGAKHLAQIVAMAGPSKI